VHLTAITHIRPLLERNACRTLRGNQSFSTKSPKASNHANLDGWKDKSIRSKRSIPTFQTITLQFLVLFAIATHFSKPFGHHGPNDLPGLILTPKNPNMPIKEKVSFSPTLIIIRCSIFPVETKV